MSRVLIVGHSLSFAAPLARRAEQAGAVVREVTRPAHGPNGWESAEADLAWADVVLAEWCLGNAVWLSRNRRPGQRLVVRFHRAELETPHPASLDMEGVDAIAFVARHVLEQACERFGWDAGDPRLRVVPNAIDLAAMAGPKLPGAERTLAMVGYVPRLKRLDLALDMLDLLRARDDRYRLLVKGRPPWQYPWMADRGEERRYFARQLERIERSPNLRRAIAFEPFGDDVAPFLRQAGWIVSTSEVEGHSLALAEGMASGAAPALLERAGAGEQYEARWVHTDPDAAARSILATVERGEWEREGKLASRFAAERWSWERIWPTWQRLLSPASAAAIDTSAAPSTAGAGA